MKTIQAQALKVGDRWVLPHGHIEVVELVKVDKGEVFVTRTSLEHPDWVPRRFRMPLAHLVSIEEEPMRYTGETEDGLSHFEGFTG